MFVLYGRVMGGIVFFEDVFVVRLVLFWFFVKFLVKFFDIWFLWYVCFGLIDSGLCN